MPWTRTRGGLVDQDGHGLAPQAALRCAAAATDFCAASARLVARDQLDPAGGQDRRPSSTWVPASRTISGTLERLHLDRLDHALGDPVAAVDAGEDVDQDRLDVLVHGHEPERLGDPLGRGAAADVEEVGGLAAGELDHVHGRHGEPGAVDDAADVALQPDIGQAAVGGLGLARVLLRLVAQLGDLRPAEQGVVVEAHLGVERRASRPPR